MSMDRWFNDSARGSLKFVEEILLGVSPFSTQIANKNNKERCSWKLANLDRSPNVEKKINKTYQATAVGAQKPSVFKISLN